MASLSASPSATLTQQRSTRLRLSDISTPRPLHTPKANEDGEIMIAKIPIYDRTLENSFLLQCCHPFVEFSSEYVQIGKSPVKILEPKMRDKSSCITKCNGIAQTCRKERKHYPSIQATSIVPFDLWKDLHHSLEHDLSEATKKKLWSCKHWCCTGICAIACFACGPGCGDECWDCCCLRDNCCKVCINNNDKFSTSACASGINEQIRSTVLKTVNRRKTEFTKAGFKLEVTALRNPNLSQTNNWIRSRCQAPTCYTIPCWCCNDSESPPNSSLFSRPLMSVTLKITGDAAVSRFPASTMSCSVRKQKIAQTSHAERKAYHPAARNMSLLSPKRLRVRRRTFAQRKKDLEGETFLQKLRRREARTIHSQITSSRNPFVRNLRVGTISSTINDSSSGYPRADGSTGTQNTITRLPVPPVMI